MNLKKRREENKRTRQVKRRKQTNTKRTSWSKLNLVKIQTFARHNRLRSLSFFYCLISLFCFVLFFSWFWMRSGEWRWVKVSWTWLLSSNVLIVSGNIIIIVNVFIFTTNTFVQVEEVGGRSAWNSFRFMSTSHWELIEHSLVATGECVLSNFL